MMLRILLINDDYRELLYLQTVLKKIGFDVLGVQNLRSIEETQLGFNPEIIFVGLKAATQQVQSACEQMRARSKKVKLIFLERGGNAAQGSGLLGYFDGLLQSPVNPTDLFKLIGEVGDVDGEFLTEKYKKLRQQLSPEDDAEFFMYDGADREEIDIWSNGGDFTDPNIPSDTQDRAAEKKNEVTVRANDNHREIELPKRSYKEHLSQMQPLENKVFDSKKVRAYHRQIRNEENLDQLQDLEQERQRFVEELFKLKKDK